MARACIVTVCAYSTLILHADDGDLIHDEDMQLI